MTDCGWCPLKEFRKKIEDGHKKESSIQAEKANNL